MNKRRKLTDKYLDELCDIADLFYSANLDKHSKAKLTFVLNALDDASDHINDYLTDSNYSVQHSYPDISDTKH